MPLRSGPGARTGPRAGEGDTNLDGVETISAEHSHAAAAKAAELAAKGEVDAIYLACNSFKNTMVQIPTVSQLLPLVRSDDETS